MLVRTRTLAIFLLLALLQIVGAESSQAKLIKTIWGPTTFAADSVRCESTHGCSAFDTYSELGVKVFQYQLLWDQVAVSKPANSRNHHDPAYDWATMDAIAADAEAHNIQIALLVRNTPSWANGGKPGNYAPYRARDYANFLYAASQRYPQIKYWMIWGEPARSVQFKPMPVNSKRGPRRYARLLNAAYFALKQSFKRNVVIGGMTLNGGNVKPPDFVKWMRLPNGKPPHMDLWGHNPFDFRKINLRLKPRGKHRGFNDLDTFYREIKRAFKRASRRVPRLWISEWTVPSDEGIPGMFGGLHVTRKEQAKRLTQIYRVANRLPFVVALGWFTLEDRSYNTGNANWGLLDKQGNAKPSFYAYRRIK